jgi:proteasome beta subunit
MARYLRAEVELYKLKRTAAMSVKAAATLTSNILRRGGGAYGYYYVGLIVGGHDREGGHVYSLDAAGGSIADHYVSVGSGSPYAYGVLEDHYKLGISLDDSINLAIRALNASMKRDSASGDGMDIITITKDGYVAVSQEEISKRASRMGINVPRPN